MESTRSGARRPQGSDHAAEAVTHQARRADAEVIHEREEISCVIGRVAGRSLAVSVSPDVIGSHPAAHAQDLHGPERNQIERSPVTPWIRTTSGPSPAC